MEQRCKTLAKIMVEKSAKVKAGEKVLVEVEGMEIELAKELIAAVYAVGGIPFYLQSCDSIKVAWLSSLGGEAAKLQAEWDRERMSQMDCYFAVRSNENLYDLSEVSTISSELYRRHYYLPVHMETRAPKTRWVVTKYPNDSMSQLAKMSTDSFADFYFNACCLDYETFEELMIPLAELLERTHTVQIVGATVNLKFSVEGIPVYKCSGDHNLPDGEVFTAPVKESVEGYIKYNTPSPYAGKLYDDVYLEFKNGKIIDVKCGDTYDDSLTSIFDTDEGARYIGEFAFGLNPFITTPMQDILFDEKISGSFHFTPGGACPDASNGNASSIHWDLVYMTGAEYGGCEIFFDGQLIQKNGVFVLPELEHLNPENLRNSLIVV